MKSDSANVPVSVVIPCFCCSATIARAIASVAHQTTKPAEVILVDDASSGDDTLPVLQQLAQKYPGWVKLLQLNENRGAANARNAGWEAANHPYVAFLDADDAWHPQKIEIQYDYMSTHPEVTLCGHGHRVLKESDTFPDWGIAEWDVKRIHKWVLMLSNRFITPSAMLRRDIKFRFVERQRYMEDHMLWLLLVCSGESVVKLSAELAAIYKSPFGVKGLSAQLWAMERGELGNYWRPCRAGCINGFQLGILEIYSLLKYVYRLLIYFWCFRWIK